jgi:hypothetical protein
MPTPLPDKEKEKISHLLKQAEEPDVVDRLTEWEQGFLSSVTGQFESKEWLSEKQVERLEQIVEGNDGRSGRDSRRNNPRPSRLSYSPSDATQRRHGGFAGFSRESPED